MVQSLSHLKAYHTTIPTTHFSTMLPPGVFRSRQLIVGTGFVLIIFSQLVLTDAFVLNHGKNALSCCSSVLSARPTADVSKMRVNEIKDELEKLNIDFIDCFDKESLVSRLVDARSGEVEPSTPKDASVEEAKKQDDDERDPKKKSSISTSETFDKEANLEEIRGMRVRELREELGRRQISRVGLFEKEDLVKALLKAREVASNFSPTGLVMPGQVADLTGDDLEEEMKHPTPMLVDIYATWCGPCQMMAPQLQQAAAETFKDKIRVAKMDSDKHPQMAGHLRVGGLPTLILFNNGKEVDRLEGALMKDQLVQWVNGKL